MSWVLLLQLPPDDRQVHGPLNNLVVMSGLGGGEEGKHLAILIPACASSRQAFLMMYSEYKLNKHGDNIQS